MIDGLNPTFGNDGPGIVLFDAECVLCSWNAGLILAHDRKDRFRLASMQGRIGAALFRQHGLDPADPVSILVLDRGAVHQDSDAVLAIYRGLGRPWSWLGALALIPRALRDPLYRWVARHRYRLFGRRETCWFPSPQDRGRIL